jgi:hypothetical protein
MHEDGVGMVRAFEQEFTGLRRRSIDERPGFFESVDGAPAEGYRAPRGLPTNSAAKVTEDVPLAAGFGRTAIVTGEYGAAVLTPLIDGLARDDLRVIPVENRFFGGTTAVAGLLVGEDLARVLADEPVGDRYLLPDVCLTNGRFLDGSSPDDLPRPVEVVATDGAALRTALRG